MAETEPAVTVPEVETPVFDPLTIDLKIPDLGVEISAKRRRALGSGLDVSEDFTPLPRVLERHTKRLGITEAQLREAAGAQGFDLDYFVGEVGRKGRRADLVLEELEASRVPALTTAPSTRKAQARGRKIAEYGYYRGKVLKEGRTFKETGVVADELTDVIRGEDQSYRVLEYDADIEGTDAIVQPGSKQFEEVMQTTGHLLDENTEAGRMRAELVEKWGQNILLESGLQRYVDPMAAYYTERQAKKLGLDEFDPEYDKLYHRSRARAMREVALMKTNGKWVAPTWMSWEKIFPDQRVSEDDDPWVKKAWDRASRVRVELVGIDSRGAPVFQLTNPVWHIFEMSDVVQSAGAGALTALGDEDDQRDIMDRLSGGALKGIENRQTFMDAALATDLARENTLAAYALGTAGFAATIFTPDLLFGIGGVGRVGRKSYKALSAIVGLKSSARVAVPDMATAALKRAQAEEVLDKAEAAFRTGRMDDAEQFLEESLPLFEEAEQAERRLRKATPGVMDQVDSVDATLYDKAKDLTPEITPDGGKRIGDVLGGRLGNLEEAVHPSKRRRAERVRQGGESLVGYPEYYDTSRIVRGVISTMGSIKAGTFRHTRDVLNQTAKLRAHAYDILAKGNLHRAAVSDDPATFKLWTEFHDYIDDAANIPLLLSKPDQWVAEASKRFNTLIKQADESGSFTHASSVEKMREMLETAAEVAGKIKIDQIGNKGRLQTALIGAVRSIRANTETRAVALVFVREQVAKIAGMRAEPVIAKATGKFEEFRTLTPMARRYMKQIYKAFDNVTEDQARIAARMMDMRANRWARETESTVEAWYQSHFPKEAFKGKEEFLAMWQKHMSEEVGEGLELPASLKKELKNALKAVEKAAAALKKAQDAVGDAKAIGDSKAAVAAEKVFDEARAAKDAADEALAAAGQAQMVAIQARKDAQKALTAANRPTVEEVVEEVAAEVVEAAPRAAAPVAAPKAAGVKSGDERIAKILTDHTYDPIDVAAELKKVLGDDWASAPVKIEGDIADDVGMLVHPSGRAIVYPDSGGAGLGPSSFGLFDGVNYGDSVSAVLAPAVGRVEADGSFKLLPNGKGRVVGQEGPSSVPGINILDEVVEAAPAAAPAPAVTPGVSEAQRVMRESLSDEQAIEFSADLGPDMWPGAKTGQPITVSGYRGAGRAEKATVYAEGVEGPVFGEAFYVAANEKVAAKFGDVEPTTVTLNNPYVIHSDADMVRLFDGKAIPYDNATRTPLLEEATRKLKADGYDGVIVNITNFADNAVDGSGASIKRVREIFGDSQVVAFKVPAAAPTRRTVRRTVKADPQVVAAAQKAFDDATTAQKAATKAKSQATKDVKKAAAALDKAQAAWDAATAASPKGKKADTVVLLKAQETLVKAQRRLGEAKAAVAQFIDESQAGAISGAIDFTATEVLNPDAFVKRLNQLKKKGAPYLADVGPKGLKEGYEPGTKLAYKDVIKASYLHAQKIVDEAAEGATFTLDDLLLPEFKTLLVQEIRAGGDVAQRPMLRALGVMADDGITAPFKMQPVDIKRALRDEDILFQAIDGVNPIYYSRLEQLAQEMPSKIGLNDVVRFLSGRGAKAEEIKWTNVQEFLDDAAAQGKKSITKEELLKHLNDNRIIIEDTQIGPLYPNQKFGYFDDARYDAIQAGEVPKPVFPLRILNGGREYREVKLRLPQPKGSQFIVPHWDEADILVFFRATTRRDTQGRRILFIEEIQSDWHQVGRKHGYGAVPIPGAGKLTFQIPDAPFKDTKAWTGLAVKRIMRMAADEGFDGVAFTSGDAVTSIPGISLPKKSAREFYDVILPSVVKKHTKAPLGKTNLAGPGDVEFMDFNFVELTPELKKSVGGPQILFQRGAPKQTDWEMKEIGEGLVELTSAEIRAGRAAGEAPAEVMGGGLVFKMDGNTLRVQSSELPEAMRGKGIGQEMYLRALRHAQEKGFDFASDIAPSPDAIAAYERLIEAGIPLTRKTVEAADGKMVQQFVATADDLAGASLDAAPRGGRVLASEPAANTRQAVETLTAEAEAEGIDKLRRSIQDLPEDAQEARATIKKQFKELFGRPRFHTGYGNKELFAVGDRLSKGNAKYLQETLANVAVGSVSPEQYRLLKYLHDNPDELTKAIGDERSTYLLFWDLRSLEATKTEAIVEAYEMAQKYGIKGVTVDDILSGRFADMAKKAGAHPRDFFRIRFVDSVRRNAQKVQKQLDDAGVDFTYKLDAPNRAMIVNTLIEKYDMDLFEAIEGAPLPPAPNLEIFLTPARKKALPRKGAGYDTFGAGAEEDYARFAAEGDRSITLDRLFEGVEAVPTRPAMGVAEPEDVGKFVPSPAGTPKKELKWYERAEARKRGRGQILRQTLRTRDKLGKAWKTDSGIATIPDHEYDVVKEFVAMVGTQRLKNVAFAIEPKIRTGMMLNEPLGLYFFGRDIIGISHSAIASGRFVDTTIHELWHGLSQYLPDATVKDLYKQFARERGQFMRANPEAFDRTGKLADISMAKNQSTYRFSSFDEWVVEKMKDLSIQDASRRLLAKGKGVDPTDLPYDKPWQQALRALADLVQGHYNQIKAIFGQDVARKTYSDFMRGKYVDQVRDTPLAAVVKITADDEAKAAARWSEYLDALDAGDDVAAAAARMSDETEQFLEAMITGPAETLTPQEFRALASEAPTPRAPGAPAAGVVETATDTPAFKSWFGGSKVVDEAGEPIVVYHGTDAKPFESFDRAKSGKGPSKVGFWFSDDGDFSSIFGTNIEVYLSIKNPKRLSSDAWDKLRRLHATDSAWFSSWRDRLIKGGYDGIIVESSTERLGRFEVRNPGIYAAFEPTQIKSVKNIGTFDPTDPRILFQEAPEGIKGATKFLEDGRSFIYALDGADFGTFVHEFGHVMRRDLGDKSMDAVTDWITSKGVKVTHKGGMFIGDKKAVEEAEELFARGFEKYIMEGKTPQPGLKSIFEKMKQWMVDIYRGVKQSEEMGEVVGLEISPALRKVFDDLLQEAPPKKSLLPRTLELLRRELAGPPMKGSQVDAVAQIVSELRRSGGHDISKEDILEQIVAVQLGKKEFIDLPGPVYLHGGAHGVDGKAAELGIEGRRFPEGKSQLTLADIINIQNDMTTSSLLLKQVATKVPLTARSQAIQEMKPSEMVDNWIKSSDRAILKVARNWMIGGDPIDDMRHLKPEVRARILSGSRLVEQAIGDTAKLIEEGDFDGLFGLLAGDLVRHKATGRQALSSGHDMMASAAASFKRVIETTSGAWWSKTDAKDKTLRGIVETREMRGGLRAFEALTGFFDKVGDRGPYRTVAELLRDPDYKDMSNIIAGVLKRSKGSIFGDLLEAAGITSNTLLQNPTKDLTVIEAIFYTMGYSRRNGKLLVDTLDDPASVSHSQAQAVALYAELRSVFGTSEKAMKEGIILANRAMSLVAGHGMAQKAQMRWVELGIAADENTMTAFKAWVNGEAVGNTEMLARVEQLYQVMGYSPRFQEITMLEGITGYVPGVARQKLAEALSRAVDPDVTGWPTSDLIEQIGGGATRGSSGQRAFAWSYRYMKTRMVRGHYVLKSRYFWMNTMDHFNQIALVAGYRPAMVSTMRLLPQNLLANPLSQIVLTGIQKAGYEGAPEKVRSILTSAGNKGADWASTILRTSKWRVDLNDIMEAGGKDIRTGKMRPKTILIGGRLYDTLDIRQTMLEEAIFSSFDTSQLGVKIKKTAEQWAKEARTVKMDPRTGKAIVNERAQSIAQRLDPRTLSKISEDIAEGWAERERAGAVITLMEMGLDPRTACRVTIDSLYDYAGSMSKFDRHILMNLFFPFWAFQKNANRQILNTVFSPAGAYRLGVMRRAYTEGSEVLSSLLYQSTVDEFGLDYNNMDSDTRRQYDMMRYMLVEEYGTMDKVPPEVQQDIRNWISGVITDRALGDGRLRALPELENFLLKIGRLRLSDYYVAEPNAKYERFYRQGRPGLRVPYPLQKSVKKYVDLLRIEDRDAPFTTIFLPEPMYEAAFKHMGYSIASLVLAVHELDAFTGINLLTDEDDGTSGVSFLDPLLEVADPSRMMIVPQALEALNVKTMAYPTALHPIIGVAADNANFDVLILEATDDALAEISAIREAEAAGEEPPEKAGVIRDPRYYLMPGALQLVYSNSPLMELNRILLQMERTPMEQRGGLRGDLVKWSRTFLGLETEEVYRHRAIKFTRSAAEKEIGSEKTKEKIRKGRKMRRKDEPPR